MNKLFLALCLLIPGLAAQANETQQEQHSKYVGQEKRAIKSLSADDIAELRRGGGWGLAKAAELNGVPGPAHLLKLKDQIPLDEDQILAITGIFQQMKTDAIERGERLIDLERQLENHFRNRTITDAILRAMLDAIANARTELRYIHLATHLKTPKILSEQQIDKYNTLRGYTDRDPCAYTPQGHDPKMWRKHNGCS